MITHLHVRDYALIDELDISFGDGFSTITGETGAGKSILLGAIGLALGERADLKALLVEDRKCVVELTVQLEHYNLKPLFEELDLDYADETILRREVLPSGKSRAFVNDTPVRLSDLSQVAERLIDIHSQNDTLLLRDPAFQLGLIDSMAENKELNDSYRTAWTKWKAAQANQKALLERATGGKDMDYQRFLYDELLEAQLENPEEEEELEQELNRLQHAEDVAGALGETGMHLSGSEGALERLNAAVNALSAAVRYDDSLQELLDRLKSAVIELDDVQREIQLYGSEMSSDPEKLRSLDERISVIRHLKTKHRVTAVAHLMEERDRLGEHLNLMEELEERIQEAEAELEQTHIELGRAAGALSASRAAVMPAIETQIAELLTELNMPAARVLMELQEAESFFESGKDRVNWSFSANAGRTVQPLGRVASGGELSRVMLALKAILSSSKSLPTIVFDEVDSGVSGETARRVAEILKRMGRSMQVVAITHLPQIAAAGRCNYKVEKTEDNGRTQTRIRMLSDQERVEEISRILSGDKPSEAARANARELLQSIGE